MTVTCAAGVGAGERSLPPEGGSEWAPSGTGEQRFGGGHGPGYAPG